MFLSLLIVWLSHFLFANIHLFLQTNKQQAEKNAVEKIVRLFHFINDNYNNKDNILKQLSL